MARNQTGESIKRAAIEQDVNSREDFFLSIELGDGRTRPVGDEEFIAVTPKGPVRRDREQKGRDHGERQAGGARWPEPDG